MIVLITNYELRITNEERRSKRDKEFFIPLRSSLLIRNSQFVIRN